MKTDKELLQKLIDGYKGNDLAQYISDELGKINTTKQKLRTIEQKKRYAKEAYDGLLKDFAKELAEAQKSCKHLSTTYHAGSGNNDSETRCNHCEKTL